MLAVDLEVAAARILIMLQDLNLTSFLTSTVEELMMMVSFEQLFSLLEMYSKLLQGISPPLSRQLALSFPLTESTYTWRTLSDRTDTIPSISVKHNATTNNFILLNVHRVITSLYYIESNTVHSYKLQNFYRATDTTGSQSSVKHNLNLCFSSNNGYVIGVCVPTSSFLCTHAYLFDKHL